MYFRLYFSVARWALMQLVTIDPTLNLCTSTNFDWMDRGSIEYEVCLILLHMVSIENGTSGLLILNPTPYPLSIVFASHGAIGRSFTVFYILQVDQRVIEILFFSWSLFSLSSLSPEIIHTYSDILCPN